MQQTSSFPLLIWQAIMIFCGGWLLMAFCWLRTHGQADCMFGCRVQGEVLCRQTWWSRVCVFVVMCLPATALSLPLWPHCVVEGNNKAATTKARCTNSCPVCPAFSCERAQWRHGTAASPREGSRQPLKRQHSHRFEFSGHRSDFCEVCEKVGTPKAHRSLNDMSVIIFGAYSDR